MRCLALLLLLLLGQPAPAHAERRFKVDSLVQRLKTLPDGEEKVILIRDIANEYSYESPAEARRYLQMGLELCGQIKATLGWYYIYAGWATFFEIQRKNDSALFYNLKAAAHMEAQPEVFKKLASFVFIESGIANGYLDANKYRESLAHFNKARDYLYHSDKKADRPDRLYVTYVLYNGLLRLYKTLGDTQSVRATLDTLFATGHALGNDPMLANAWFQRAQAATRFGWNPDTCLADLDQAIGYHRKGKNYPGLGMAFQMKADILCASRRPAEALAPADSSLRYAALIGDSATAREVVSILCLSYLQLKDAARLAPAAARLRLLTAQLPETTQPQYWQILSDSYAFLNQPADALQYLLQYTRQTQKIHEASTGQALADAMLKYETAEKEKQLAEKTLALNRQKLTQVELEKNMKLAMLRYEFDKKERAAKTEKEKQAIRYAAQLQQQEIENKTALQRQALQNEAALAQATLRTSGLHKDKQIAEQKATLSRRRLMSTGFASLAGLLAIGGGFGYARYHARTRNERLLAQKNERIETLIRELHHRVKNNMQMMSSLLSLQAGSLADPGARAAMEESRHRIEALNLIHQKLYLEDHIADVDMKAYFEELVQGLARSFRGADGGLQVHTDIAPLQLPIDTAVPLGLITNELVTNALKYGTTAAEPALWVTLSGSEGNWQLQVRDNGAGAPPEAPGNPQGLGKRLIAALAGQIKATVALQTDAGTTVTVQGMQPAH